MKRPRYGAVYDATAIRVPLDSQYSHDLKKMRAAVNDKRGWSTFVTLTIPPRP